MHQYWFFILNLTRVIRGLIPCLIQHWFPTLRSILNLINNTVSFYRWRIASNRREGKLVRVISQFVLIFHAVNSHKESYAFSFRQSRQIVSAMTCRFEDLIKGWWLLKYYREWLCIQFTSMVLLLSSFESLIQKHIKINLVYFSSGLHCPGVSNLYLICVSEILLFIKKKKKHY